MKAAVDWYYEQTVVLGNTNYAELLEQAKQMEKDQAFELFKAGQDSMEERGKNFEKYYEKYNGSSVVKNRD